jgi:hypothetical protein
LEHSNPWVQQNQWLLWAFYVATAVCGVGSIMAARWFRRWIGIPRDDGMGRTAILQETGVDTAPPWPLAHLLGRSQ